MIYFYLQVMNVVQKKEICMTEKDYQLYGTKILNLHSIYNWVNKFAIMCGIEWPFFTKSKILEKEGKTQEIGLLIFIWKNKFADGEVDFATCIDKNDKHCNIELDNIR